MTGQQQRSPRWKDCAQVPATILPLAAGAIYVNAHFNSDDKREAMVREEATPNRRICSGNDRNVAQLVH